MLDSKTHELAALEIEGLVSHGECSLNSLGSVEFDIGNSLTAATTSVTNDADVSDLTAISLAEEVPDISFLGLEGETVNKDSVILSLGFLHLFLCLMEFLFGFLNLLLLLIQNDLLLEIMFHFFSFCGVYLPHFLDLSSLLEVWVLLLTSTLISFAVVSIARWPFLISAVVVSISIISVTSISFSFPFSVSSIASVASISTISIVPITMPIIFLSWLFLVFAVMFVFLLVLLLVGAISGPTFLLAAAPTVGAST